MSSFKQLTKIINVKNTRLENILTCYTGSDWIPLANSVRLYHKKMIIPKEIIIDEDEYFRLRLLYWNQNSEQNIHCHPEYQSIGSKVLSGHLIERIYTPTIYQRSLTSINGITCLNGEDYHDMKALNDSVTLNIDIK